MNGTVTISVGDYDVMMKEKKHLEERVSRLELEKTPILTIEFEIKERFTYNYGCKTFVLSNNAQMFEVKNEIKSLVEETVEKLIDKNEEIKALRKMPKWFVNLFKK